MDRALGCGPKGPAFESRQACSGEVPEWLKGAVSKTVVCLWWTLGSNPSLSAKFLFLGFGRNFGQILFPPLFFAQFCADSTGGSRLYCALVRSYKSSLSWNFDARDDCDGADHIDRSCKG